jgi:hypothetical protein
MSMLPHTEHARPSRPHRALTARRGHGLQTAHRPPDDTSTSPAAVAERALDATLVRDVEPTREDVISHLSSCTQQ